MTSVEWLVRACRPLLAAGLLVLVCLGAHGQQRSDQPAGKQAPAVSQPQTVPGAAPDFRDLSVVPSAPGAALRTSTFRKALDEWAGKLLPDQGGVLWIAAIVYMVVAFSYRRPFSWRNLDVVLLVVPAILFVDIVRFSMAEQDPVKFSLAGVVFLGVFLTTVILFARALVGGTRQPPEPWTPNLSQAPLATLAIALVICNIGMALAHVPDDCGAYTNLGAKRMLETGYFPYGDPLLRGGAAATYGPLLYVAHIPFQLAVRDIEPGFVQGGVTWPPMLATKLTLISFHILGLVALFLIGRKLAGAALGWSLVCLYAGSAYVQGLGGDSYFAGGMMYISHIAPAAVTLLAFLMIDSPVWSGVVLAVGAGVLFYPAFFFPLWLGYYFWRRQGWLKFGTAFAASCAVILIAVLLLTQTGPNESALHVLRESTVAHQESATAYGSSTFGFWGTHPRLAAFLQKPLLPNADLLKPAFVLFLIFLCLTFFLAKRKSVRQMALLTASIALATQLWKTHAGGTYVEWYLPFFLIGTFAPTAPSEPGSPGSHTITTFAREEPAEVIDAPGAHR